MIVYFLSYFLLGLLTVLTFRKLYGPNSLLVWLATIVFWPMVILAAVVEWMRETEL
jgi:predicted membrane metal-binding protein